MPDLPTLPNWYTAKSLMMVKIIAFLSIVFSSIQKAKYLQILFGFDRCEQFVLYKLECIFCSFFNWNKTLFISFSCFFIKPSRTNQIFLGLLIPNT
jgi:hypothetical protein